MTEFKFFKSIFLTSVLAFGISVITSQNVFAATIANYTVKSGDCLSLIAQEYGESLTNLREANNNLGDIIFPGQVLKVSGTANSTVNPIAIKYTAADLDLLSRLISAEARGETYNAQVGVGAVVVNRVKGSSFPHSINDVINQHTNDCYQFTPVLNGSINESAPTSDVKAAYAALSGEDPTYKASYFYDGTAPNAWFLTQRVSMKIDNLSFAY